MGDENSFIIDKKGMGNAKTRAKKKVSQQELLFLCIGSSDCDRTSHMISRSRLRG